ncbi:condensation domain-containing protein [Streptomyces virginiae]|uniref:condensation domain-containing protein n=1 Tax=Streptomyces virginiae TaxID=1961 RepID=UPI00368FAEE7
MSEPAAFPLNSTSKTDREIVAHLLDEPAAEDPQASPASTIMDDVRGILALPRLGNQDDLVRAGANSLEVLRLAARLRSRLGSSLTASDVYRLRTIEAISAYCSDWAGSAAQLPSIQEGDAAPAPLSHAQRRFWLAEMTDPGAADNLIVLSFALTGALKPESLVEAVADVVKLHPVLRTTYSWLGEAPIQMILPPEACAVVVEHVGRPSQAAGVGLQALAEAVTADWWQQPFSLEDEALIRVRLCRLGADQHLLCLAVHHIAFDGWSESVLLADLQAAYKARLSGQDPPTARRLSYSQYSSWEATRLADWTQRDLPFWRTELVTAPAPFLPAPTGTGEARRLETVFEVDSDTVGRLERVSADRGGPVLAALVAGAARALANVFHAPELALGSVTAGRFDPALESVIGCFINPFVVKLSSAPDGEPAALLDQAVTRVVSTLKHVNTPFDELVREFAHARKRHPWFQVLVILQGQPPSGSLYGGVAVKPVRVRPPTTANELMMEAIPTRDGSWRIVTSWRDDGITATQGRRLRDELRTALAEISGLAR